MCIIIVIIIIIIVTKVGPFGRAGPPDGRPARRATAARRSKKEEGHMCVCMYVYIYIYIYMYVHRERER